jgi:23S rRNA pseudouridine1911/1915/1917 synthase
MSKIVYKDKRIIAVIKPAGTPSQPDNTGTPDAMTLAERELSALGESPQLYLVHRLDLPVGGLIVFARSRSIAAKLSSLFAESGVVKEYIAVTEGECEGGRYTDYLVKNATLKRAEIAKSEKQSGAKPAALTCTPLSKIGEGKSARTLVKVELETGRFHQIRAQLSSRSTPIVGDKKYGSRDFGAHTPSLFASRVAFSLDGEKIDISAIPDVLEYPWSNFAEEIMNLYPNIKGI